jgi:hypothetical protein
MLVSGGGGRAGTPGGAEVGLSVLFAGRGGRDVGDVVTGGLQMSRSAVAGCG